MNWVQTVTQKYHRVENQFEKPGRMHKHPAGPAGTPRRAHSRPYRGQAWPCRGRGPLPYRSPSRRVAAPRARPCDPCRKRPAPRPCAPCPARVAGLHGRIVSAQAAVSWAPVGSVAALRARVSRPSAKCPRALRSPVRPACPAA